MDDGKIENFESFDKPKTITASIKALPYIKMYIDIDVYFTSVILTIRDGELILLRELLEEDFASDISLSKKLVNNVAKSLKPFLSKDEQEYAIIYAYKFLTDVSPKLNAYYKKFLEFEKNGGIK